MPKGEPVFVKVKNEQEQTLKTRIDKNIAR